MEENNVQTSQALFGEYFTITIYWNAPSDVFQMTDNSDILNTLCGSNCHMLVCIQMHTLSTIEWKLEMIEIEL